MYFVKKKLEIYHKPMSIKPLLSEHIGAYSLALFGSTVPMGES